MCNITLQAEIKQWFVILYTRMILYTYSMEVQKPISK